MVLNIFRSIILEIILIMQKYYTGIIMENTHLVVNDNTLNKILDGVKSVFVLNEL